MADVHDVAAFILTLADEPITTMKLQKLCYYAQGHSLAWDGVPLFDEEIQAWANGPVCYALFDTHRGTFRIEDIVGDPEALTEDERETVEAVWGAYGHLSGYQLSMMTHEEDPWKNAREGLSATARSFKVISLDDMQDYFGSLVAQEN
jgi:uncharacterized phage-associated protein